MALAALRPEERTGLAVAVVLLWAISGPVFHFSETWQLVINTGTTIVTFLMVFLIQSTQNSDTDAMQIKLDELIRATRGAHNRLLDLEEREEGELDDLRQQYEDMAARARGQRQPGLAALGRHAQPCRRLRRHARRLRHAGLLHVCQRRWVTD